MVFKKQLLTIILLGFAHNQTRTESETASAIAMYGITCAASYSGAQQKMPWKGAIAGTVLALFASGIEEQSNKNVNASLRAIAIIAGALSGNFLGNIKNR